MIMKRLSAALAAFFVLASSAMAAGTIPISLTQRFDNSTHLPLSGGQIYFIQAGTTSTPQNAFQDSALTIPYANPLTLDAGGNIPQLFFADGTIKIRITNKVGVTQVVQDNILVIGPSSGGGGGGTVDPTTILATGDIKSAYGTSVLSGWVRANGRTIGSATSGATERANADTQALFVYLWGTDGSLAVSGGRGASAAADWAANKTIALPDFRGRVLAGFDDMGSSAAGRLTTATMSGVGIGAVGGAETRTLTLAQIPSHTHANTLTDPGHVHGEIATASPGGSFTVSAFNGNLAGGGFGGFNTQSAVTGITINNAAAGGGGSHPIVQPTIFVTTYLKL
jgi:microcystin-dependent protein